MSSEDDDDDDDDELVHVGGGSDSRANWATRKELRESRETPDCFIATTVYGGNPNAPEVQVLRDFRDNVLSETIIGRLAIEFYYSGVGEKVANLIKNYTPSQIPTIRKGLDYIVQKHKDN